MKKSEKSVQSSKPSAHWRAVAAKSFPELKEILVAHDEQYAIYNVFFDLRGQLREAISQRDKERALRILDFAGRCLQRKLKSSREDISVAAGTGLFEHVFEDSPSKHWPMIFSCMPRRTYDACRAYVRRWMEPDAFSKVDKASREHYR